MVIRSGADATAQASAGASRRRIGGRLLRIIDSRVTVSILAVGVLVTSLGWWKSARPAAADWGNVSEIVTAVATPFLGLGIYFAYRQLRFAVQAVRAQERATKAELLMQFNNEWRSDLLYEGTRYIHSLRNEWEKSGRECGQAALPTSGSGPKMGTRSSASELQRVVPR
jgi:hypothetical protein